MYYSYIIQSEKYPDQKYTGYTSDLKQRIKHHNEGASPHTNKFKPWQVVFYACFSTEERARDFEQYLKTASGIAFRNKRLV